MRRIGLVIGLGIDIASAALFILNRLVVVCHASAGMPMVPARDVPQGVLIDRTAVTVALWPAGTQPAGAYATVDAVVGHMSGRDMQKGDALVPVRLAHKDPVGPPFR
jgi:flagella basal body P-ring formation protein FlgA